jgi:hypothetical protein
MCRISSSSDGRRKDSSAAWRKWRLRAKLVLATAVDGVADDGEADVGQVDANLVFAAGVGAALGVGVGLYPAIVGQGAIGGLRRAGVATRRRHRHLLPVARVAADGRVDERFRRLEAPLTRAR